MNKLKTNPNKIPIPSKLKSIEHLQTILEILNGHPDEYLPLSKLETEFKERLNLKDKLDQIALHNSLQNTLIFAEGINDKIGRPKTDTPEYLGAIAQIWQTKLIDMEPLSVNGKEENCYMIKIKGIEVLNKLQLNENIIKFNRSSDKASTALGVLTIFLVALAAIQILLFLYSQPALATYIVPTESMLAVVMLGVIIVERYFLFGSGDIKILKNKTDEKATKRWIIILVISSVITLFVIIGLWSLFRFANWSATTILETLVGVLVAYSIFIYGLILKYAAIPIQTKLCAWLEIKFMKDWKDKKKRMVFVPIAVFLRVIPILIILLWIALDFASASVSQIITYEVFGGITGAWALGLFFENFGIDRI